MGRLAHSWQLTKQSAAVLKQDKELLWMPILSFLASLVALMGITGVGAAAGVFPEATNPDGSVKPLSIALGFCIYLALAFVTLFFNAAVVAGATERLKGGDPTVKSALAAAWARAGRIFLWSLVVATVNMVLQMLREAASRSRSPFLGQILVSLGAAMWTYLTYFMVPILLFENEGLGSSVKRSGSLFKKTWGESVVGEAGIGLVATVFTFLAILVGGFLLMGMASLGTFGIILGVVVLVALVAGVVSYFSTLQAVYKAALYQFAATHEVPPGFSQDQVAGAFHKAPGTQGASPQPL